MCTILLFNEYQKPFLIKEKNIKEETNMRYFAKYIMVFQFGCYLALIEAIVFLFTFILFEFLGKLVLPTLPYLGIENYSLASKQGL